MVRTFISPLFYFLVIHLPRLYFFFITLLKITQLKSIAFVKVYIYGLPKGIERKRRELDQVKCVKYEEKLCIQEKDIKDRWNKYFHNLFNETHEILLDCNRLDSTE